MGHGPGMGFASPARRGGSMNETQLPRRPRCPAPLASDDEGPGAIRGFSHVRPCGRGGAGSADMHRRLTVSMVRYWTDGRGSPLTHENIGVP